MRKNRGGSAVGYMLVDGVYTVSLGVAYGDHVYLEDNVAGSQICVPGAGRSAFCAVSDLSLVVTKRL